ncbi:MAG: DUF1244 domain-containing protein [Methylococcales bacterium]
MDKRSQTEIEAAAFRRLVKHLQDHPEVQNIELMIAGRFCRNCLAKWYDGAAKEQAIELNYTAALEEIYGMPYQKWKENHQTEATPEQLTAYEEIQRRTSGNPQ